MSFSLSKLRSLLPGQGSSDGAGKRHSVSLEPEVGFQLTLEPQSTIAAITTIKGEVIGGNNNGNGAMTGGGTGTSTIFATSKSDRNIPELNVHLVGARHLPTMFGLKSVQGYVVKVKLFPGSKKYDSTIQTNSWPKFNENFKFPMVPELKPSIKHYSKDKSSNDNLPEKCFSGHFVVFTVYALLELPPGTFDRFKGTYRSLRDKGVSLLKTKAETNKKGTKDDTKEKQDELVTNLTKSETKRNIGSVTCYLEPKLFKKSTKGQQFLTEEFWLPIKDITATASKKYNISTSLKGQIELILELHDSTKDNTANPDDSGGGGGDNSGNKDTSTNTTTKRQWSLTEMKKKMKSSGKSSKYAKDLCLKVTTSKMRCSIKVKDEFESTAGLIYVKTTVFEHDILSNSWKSDNFQPSLSTRWDPEISTIEIPLNDEKDVEKISIKTTVAFKNKLGKKIVLGTVLISPEGSGVELEHWRSATTKINEPIAMYHNFM